MVRKNNIQKEADKRSIKNFDVFKKLIEKKEVFNSFENIYETHYYLSKGFNLKFHMYNCFNLKDCYKQYKNNYTPYDRVINPNLIKKYI